MGLNMRNSLKIAVPLLIFCSILIESKGQQSRKINFGIQAGPSLTTITGEYHTSWQKNYLIGFTANVPLSQYFSLAFELNYERKGINSGHTPLGTGIPFTIQEYFHYITNYSLLEVSAGKRHGGFAGTGVYTGYLAGRTNASQADLNVKYDLGLLLRVGYFILFKNGAQFRVYTGYAKGYVTIDEDRYDRNLNQSWMLAAGFGF